MSVFGLYHGDFPLIEAYGYYIIIFIGILLSYLIVSPFVKWFVTLGSIRLLSYIMIGLIAFISISYIEVLNNSLKILLHCLAVFGVVLVLFHGLQSIRRRQGKRAKY